MLTATEAPTRRRDIFKPNQNNIGSALTADEILSKT